MQTKHLCVLIHIWTKGEVGAPLNLFEPSSGIFVLTVPRWFFFCGSFMLFLSCFVIVSCTSFCWCLVTNCWERADLLAVVVMSNCDLVTFPLVAWLYRFLIFALFLTYFEYCWSQHHNSHFIFKLSVTMAIHMFHGHGWALSFIQGRSYGSPINIKTQFS